MYIVEGNMGVGKSTFLSVIRQHCSNLAIHYEPKENWMNDENGQSLLECFFKDKKRWEFTAETFIMLCRVKEQHKIQTTNHSHLIMERSIYTGHYCYARTACAMGLFTRLEWNLYNQFADYLINQSTQPPQGFIYLRSNPDVCYSRVKKRNWKSEKLAPFSFLEQLHVAHEKFLIDKHDVFPNLKQIPVLVLDANKEFEADAAVQREYVAKIQDFVAATQPVGPSVRIGDFVGKRSQKSL